MINDETKDALRTLRSLARELRMRCDAITMSVDAISTACEEAISASDSDRVADVAADRMQPALMNATREAESLRSDIRTMDMRLEDVWMALD